MGVKNYVEQVKCAKSRFIQGTNHVALVDRICAEAMSYIDF